MEEFMNKGIEMKMIIAGEVAGILSGSLGWTFGQVNGRGMVLAFFLTIGVIMIEKTSKQRLASDRYPEISKILKAIIFSGLLSGLFGYYAVMTNGIPSDSGNIYHPYIFSYPKFILLISLYPLFILPAFFSKRKFLFTLIAGTCASLIIEICRALEFGEGSSYAINAVMFTGFPFTLLWVLFMGFAGRQPKIQVA